MQSNPEFTYDEELGLTTCVFEIDNVKYGGTAKCHPNDVDMKNHLTGSEIAFRRACISYLKHLRDYDIVPKLEILKHMYSCMEQAASFNPKDNNARLMRRAIEDYSLSAKSVRETIREERDNLYKYMEDKAKVYKHIRSRRLKEAKNN